MEINKTILIHKIYDVVKKSASSVGTTVSDFVIKATDKDIEKISTLTHVFLPKYLRIFLKEEHYHAFIKKNFDFIKNKLIDLESNKKPILVVNQKLVKPINILLKNKALKKKTMNKNKAESNKNKAEPNKNKAEPNKNKETLTAKVKKRKSRI